MLIETHIWHGYENQRPETVMKDANQNKWSTNFHPERANRENGTIPLQNFYSLLSKISPGIEDLKIRSPFISQKHFPETLL